MDKNQLIKECERFANACEAKGLTINFLKLRQAYPGISNSSFIMTIGADWIENFTCYEAIHKLSTIMWEVMSLEARQNIFSIDFLTRKKHRHPTTIEEMVLVNKL